MLYIVGTQIDTRNTQQPTGQLVNRNARRKVTWLPPDDIWELASIRRSRETNDVEYSFMSWKTKEFKTIPFPDCGAADQAIASARNEQIVDDDDRSKVDMEEKASHLNDILNPKPKQRGQ